MIYKLKVYFMRIQKRISQLKDYLVEYYLYVKNYIQCIYNLICIYICPEL